MSVWEFLNLNLISEVIGALVFGLIAALLFYKYQKNQVRSELMQTTKDLLESQISENIEVCKDIWAALDKGWTRLIPNPFRVSGIQVILESGFIKDMESDVAKLILDVYDKLILANRLNSQIVEYTIGVNSAMSKSENVRENISKYLSMLLPILDKELKDLKKLLENK